MKRLAFWAHRGAVSRSRCRSIAGIEKPDAGKIIVNDTVFFDKAPGKKAKVDPFSPAEKNGAAVSELHAVSEFDH